MVREALLLAIVAWPALASAARANERSAELVNSFLSFCTPGPPDLAALDAKAKAMNLPVHRDTTAGPATHTKSWLVTLKSGKHELMAGQTHAADGDAVGCSVGAEDANGDDVKQELITSLKLGAPMREIPSSDGTQRITMWEYADDVTLMVVDGTPMKIPGILLMLRRQTKTSQ
jgi:hypothetical protein